MSFFDLHLLLKKLKLRLKCFLSQFAPETSDTEYQKNLQELRENLTCLQSKYLRELEILLNLFILVIVLVIVAVYVVLILSYLGKPPHVALQSLVTAWIGLALKYIYKNIIQVKENLIEIAKLLAKLDIDKSVN